MIDSNGHIRCSKCGKKHALKLDGKLEWYCPRCHFYNIESNPKLDKDKEVVIELKGS